MWFNRVLTLTGNKLTGGLPWSQKNFPPSLRYFNLSVDHPSWCVWRNSCDCLVACFDRVLRVANNLLTILPPRWLLDKNDLEKNFCGNSFPGSRSIWQLKGKTDSEITNADPLLALTTEACGIKCPAGHGCNRNAYAFRSEVRLFILLAVLPIFHSYSDSVPLVVRCQETAPTCPQGKYSPGGDVYECKSCNAGSYGKSKGSTKASCNGDCHAGYYCPPGSTKATEVKCPAGQWSKAAAGAASGCIKCPAGRFGRPEDVLTSDACSGPCPAGQYSSKAGSTACTGCTVGQYSTSGQAGCTPCPAGRYGESTMLASEKCTGKCVAGRWGASVGLSKADCSGLCPVGK
jgi:hypothetical protein